MAMGGGGLHRCTFIPNRGTSSRGPRDDVPRFGTNVHLCGPPHVHPQALSCGHSTETQEALDDCSRSDVEPRARRSVVISRVYSPASAPTGRASQRANGRASQRANGTRARGSVYSPASAPTGAPEAALLARAPALLAPPGSCGRRIHSRCGLAVGWCVTSSPLLKPWLRCTYRVPS